MSFTDHLKGLAKLEDNAGKKVAFHSAAIEIEELQAENEELKRSLELKHPVLGHMEQDINKIKADAIRLYSEHISYCQNVTFEVPMTPEEYANKLEGKL